jgi:hypothetical protein
MDSARAGILIALVAACGVFGCRNAPSAAKKTDVPVEGTNSVAATDLKTHLRDNCASLLLDLLNDEKNLDKLLIVKRESTGLNQLVKDISAAANAGAKKLEQLAIADHSLHLHAMALPSGEAATRDSISKAKASELLHAKGPEFEFKILLTQIEALNYGTHLAKVAGENESRPDQARQWFALGDELKGLHQRTLTLLRTHENNHEHAGL